MEEKGKEEELDVKKKNNREKKTYRRLLQLQAAAYDEEVGERERVGRDLYRRGGGKRLDRKKDWLEEISSQQLDYG